MRKLFFIITLIILCFCFTLTVNAYDVINIDLNGSTSDPNYSGYGPFADDYSGAVVLDEWDGYLSTKGATMTSPRCEDIGVPSTQGTYARAVFIVDPCSHSYVSGGAGDLIGDGFESDYTGDNNALFPKLYIYGNWAYGGIFDLYVITATAGTVYIRDGQGTVQIGAVSGGSQGPPWNAGQNYIMFSDVWVGGTDTRDANGPDDDYLTNDEYLTDPNCLVIGYNGQINGIQLASVKRRVRMAGYPADPCVVAKDRPGGLERRAKVKGIWRVETPSKVVANQLDFQSTNILCGDYDAYYETNALAGEHDYGGPDAGWATTDRNFLIDYVDQNWVKAGYVTQINTSEWGEYDIITTADTKGRYQIKALVNCWWAAANIGIYVDDSEELGKLVQLRYYDEENPGDDMNPAEMDPNAIYWAYDETTFDAGTGSPLEVNFFTGFHKLRWRQNGAYCNILGFNIDYVGLINVPDCETVHRYRLGIPGDLNSDCYVNLGDLKLFVDQWLLCNNPEDPRCTVQEP